MKTFALVAFGLTMLLYLWFPANMIWHTEKVLQTGTEYRFLLQPVDPYDIFRGHYVMLNYNTVPLPLPLKDSLSMYETIYVTMRKDSAGFAQFDQVYMKPPSQDYIATQIRNYDNKNVEVSIPESMRYYYLNEKMAPRVEEAFARRSDGTTQNRAYVDVRVRNGEVVVDKLYINDLEVYEFLKK